VNNKQPPADNEIPLLLEIARVLGASLSLQDTFTTVITHLAERFSIDRATVSLIDAAWEEFQIFALYTRLHTELDQNRFYPLLRSHVAWVAQHRRANIFDDLAQAPYWDAQTLAEEGLLSGIAIPLWEPQATANHNHNSAQLFGVFSIFSAQAGVYKTDDVDFLSQVAVYLAGATAAAQQFEDVTRQARWLEMMHHLEDELGRTLVVEEILDIVSHHATQTMQADRTLAILADDLPAYLTRNNAPAPDNIPYHLAGPGIRQPSGSHGLGDFGALVTIPAKRKTPALSPFVPEEDITDTPLEFLYHSEGLRALAVVPIVINDKLAGLLLVGWRQEGAVSQASLPVLSDLAMHLGFALRNAALAARLAMHEDKR
jgi:GAF domain-containing protein